MIKYLKKNSLARSDYVHTKPSILPGGEVRGVIGDLELGEGPFGVSRNELQAVFLGAYKAKLYYLEVELGESSVQKR